MFAHRSWWGLSLVVVLVAGQLLPGADSKRRPRRPEPAPVKGDAYPLLFLGPEGAVLFNLVVDTGKRTIGDTRRDYSDVVFRSLDADASKALEPAEAAKIPQNGQLSANVPRLGDQWKSLDLNPADDLIDPDELFAFVDRALGPRLRVALETRQQQSARLFAPLDLNGDEHVAKDELAAGLDILHINDFDDDGTLSLAELQPYPTAMRLAILQQEAENSGEIPLMTLASDEDRAAACQRLLNFYGSGDESSRSRTMPSERIGGTAGEDVAAHDRNSDGQLDAEELAALLAADAPRLIVGALIQFNRVQDPDKEVQNLVEHATATTRPTGLLDFRLGGMPVKMRASINKDGGMADPVVIENFVGVQFLQADGDKNRYLDATEYTQVRAQFAMLNLPDVEYAVIDADGDGMLMQDEVKAYARTHAGLAEATLVVTVRDDATTLFDILDGNSDNRLSPREFQEGAIRLKRYDHDRDGRFGMTEMRSEFALKVSRTRPQFLDQTRQQNPNANVGVPRFTPDTSGPTWFRKMDRNQDGDVAWREFLGPRADFDRIDADGNALIDLNEAAAAE